MADTYAGTYCRLDTVLMVGYHECGCQFVGIPVQNTDGGEDYFRNNRNRSPCSRRNFLLRPEAWKAPEDAVAVISVVGDRYDAEQQRQAGC